MKPVGAKQLWECFLVKNKTCHTKFYDNGGSNVQDIYPGIKVKNLECVGHAPKRVDSSLRNLNKQLKGLGRKCKLASTMTDRLKNYYGLPNQNEKIEINTGQHSFM